MACTSYKNELVCRKIPRENMLLFLAWIMFLHEWVPVLLSKNIPLIYVWYLTSRLIRALFSQKRVDPNQVNVLLRKIRPESRRTDVISPITEVPSPVLSPPPLINIIKPTIGGAIGYKVSPIQEIPAPNLSRFIQK